MHEKKSTILVVDDELQIQKMLGILLDASNFKIIESTTGKQAIRMAASTKPDLILLDLGLGDMDGKQVVTAVREWSQVPIIILSVRADDDEVVQALDLGADDYVIKPFNVDVLLARINANLRKSAVREAGEPEISNGHLRMDLIRHQVFLEDKQISLTPKEYDLLRHFIVNRGKMLTHKDILREVWGAAHSEDKQYLRVFVGQIREKIEKEPSNPTMIVTEPGIGYRMEVVEAKAKAA